MLYKKTIPKKQRGNIKGKVVTVDTLERRQQVLKNQGEENVNAKEKI